ncbi:DUF977 family protein [Patescibacteria group bacterium]|nr:DUF977 family protein [Patescibacteria group bacterium]MCG2695196.1 DUF977 family protein [Candidatus Parcubacteria bacterium]
MNYLTLILIAITGIIIGSYFGSKKITDGQNNLIFGQVKKKQENKEKILDLMRNGRGQNAEQTQKITNNDVEKICNVSNATAERYLDQLEKEGKLIQHGKIGTDVFYTLK